MKTIKVFSIFIIALLMGCSNDSPSDSIIVPSVTYSEHIQPLLAKHCIACHKSNEIAPFPLEDYHQAKIMAQDMKIATGNRNMPPYRMDASGSCQTFADYGWLTDEEINLFAQWADEGMPEGPAKTPTQPKLTEHLPVDNYALTMADFYMPSTLTPDDYRCFPMDTGLTQPAFLTAYELTPGDARVVHHMSMFLIDEYSYQEALVLSAQSAGLGYDCMGNMLVSNANTQFLLSWAPGTGTVHFPNQSGIKLNAGQKVMMQTHYNTASGSFPDKSTLKLAYNAQVPIEGTMISLANRGISIPPGQTDYAISKLFPMNSLFNTDRNIWGIAPHAHSIGSVLTASRINSLNQEQCLGHIPRWDFNWQRMFYFNQPTRLNLADSIQLDCHYNSTSRSQVTNWGYGSENEMCMLFLYSTPAN